MFFEKDYFNVKIILLEENYCLIKCILEVVNCVIENNGNCKLKNFWISNVEGKKIFYYKVLMEKEEVVYVVMKI